VWDAALDELEAPLLEPNETTTTTDATSAGQPTTSTTEPPPGETPVLDALVEGGFLSFDPAADGASLAAVAASSPSVVAVTGPGVEQDLRSLLVVLVDGVLGRGLPTVVAEVFVDPDDEESDPPERGETALAAVPEGTSAQLSIVDHLEQRVGQVAAVLALADLRSSVAGHYGLGDGAASLIPTWTPLPG
jgi:hypothetical protein